MIEASVTVLQNSQSVTLNLTANNPNSQLGKKGKLTAANQGN